MSTGPHRKGTGLWRGTNTLHSSIAAFSVDSGSTWHNIRLENHLPELEDDANSHHFETTAPISANAVPIGSNSQVTSGSEHGNVPSLPSATVVPKTPTHTTFTAEIKLFQPQKNPDEGHTHSSTTFLEQQATEHKKTDASVIGRGRGPLFLPSPTNTNSCAMTTLSNFSDDASCAEQRKGDMPENMATDTGSLSSPSMLMPLQQ